MKQRIPLTTVIAHTLSTKPYENLLKTLEMLHVCGQTLLPFHVLHANKSDSW